MADQSRTNILCFMIPRLVRPDGVIQSRYVTFIRSVSPKLFGNEMTKVIWLKNFTRRLAESMRNHSLPLELALSGEIRFKPP